MFYIKKVDDLRSLGYKVRVMHYRNKDNNDNIKPRGGKTVVTVTDNNGNTFKGLATCSDNDGFNKRIGVAIAIGRALRHEAI
jgi:hypothetical protein